MGAVAWPPSTVEHGVAACLDELELVDAAFERPGGPAGERLRMEFCSGCPIATQCLMHAMEVGEAGVWGGTSGHTRSRAGAPHWRTHH